MYFSVCTHEHKYLFIEYILLAAFSRKENSFVTVIRFFNSRLCAATIWTQRENFWLYNSYDWYNKVQNYILKDFELFSINCQGKNVLNFVL